MGVHLVKRFRVSVECYMGLRQCFKLRGQNVSLVGAVLKCWL